MASEGNINIIVKETVLPYGNAFTVLFKTIEWTKVSYKNISREYKFYDKCLSIAFQLNRTVKKEYRNEKRKDDQSRFFYMI